jgi:hypothetical protein
MTTTGIFRGPRQVWRVVTYLGGCGGSPLGSHKGPTHNIPALIFFLSVRESHWGVRQGLHHRQVFFFTSSTRSERYQKSIRFDLHMCYRKNDEN